jgi:hypothetical protein
MTRRIPLKPVYGPGNWLTPAIPAIQKAATGMIMVQGQAGQKVSKTPSQTITGHVGATYFNNIGSINRRLTIQASLGKNTRP